MQLNLVGNGLYVSTCPQVEEDSDGGIRYTNVLDQSSVDEAFHLCPDLVVRCRLDEVLAVLPHQLGGHPVDQVQVDVVKLQLLQAPAECALDVLALILPEFGGDKHFLSLDTGLEGLLESLTDGLLILIDAGGVDVTVAVGDNGLIDDLNGVTFGREEGAQTDLGELAAIVEGHVGLLLGGVYHIFKLF